jgi:hypothetical protein
LLISLAETALFVAAFNSEDPGVLQVAQRCEFLLCSLPPTQFLTPNSSTVFGLSPDVVAATLGDIGVEEVFGLDAMVSCTFFREVFIS